MAAKKPSKELLDLLAEHDPSVVELYLALRSLIVETAPSAKETVYQASYTISDIFSFTDRWQDSFCFVTIHSKHANLGFSQGARLKDPYRKLEGKGNQMRHIKVKSLEDLQNEDLRHFLNAAITLAQEEIQ
jgi:hypothetical protein